jgi:tripartite-type tricarboxylate transporter receptor subunit TctC
VPTIGETLPGFSADPWFGVFVPRGTPAPIIERLNTAVNKLQDEEELKKSLVGQGMLPRAGTPAAFNDIVRKDYARWLKVVSDIGFKPD